MNWKRAAEEDLRKYVAQKQSLINIPQRIEALKVKFTALKGQATNSEPVQGGMSHMEDNMLDNIVERERLDATYRATKRLVQLVERGLLGLDEQERKVLDTFYINRRRNHVERLMDEMHVEQARVYQIKDKALHKFTITMYGLVEY